MKSVNIPPQIVAKLAVCIMVLALLLGAGILPQYRAIEQTKRDIADANHAMQRHNALMPTYAKLKIALDKGLPEAFPGTREISLTRERITEIPATLREMALSHGVRTEAIVPDPSSIAADGNNVSVNCSFRAPLPALQDLLLELGALSCLAHVEQITVREDHTEATMQLKTWLALQ